MCIANLLFRLYVTSDTCNSPSATTYNKADLVLGNQKDSSLIKDIIYLQFRGTKINQICSHVVSTSCTKETNSGGAAAARPGPADPSA